MALPDSHTLKQQNRDYILQPASSIKALLDNGPDIITSAKGCTIQDSEGRELLDARMAHEEEIKGDWGFVGRG